MKRKGLTKWVSMLAILSMLVLAGCGGASDADKGNGKLAEEQVLNVGRVPSEPPSLDPLKATDNVSGLILRHVMEGLTRMGEDGKPKPAVAEKWDINEDATKITFHLRKDAKWSNGDPVKAEDFEYAWKRVLNPDNAADYAYQLFYLKNGEKYHAGKAKVEEVGVKAVDDQTLEVELEKPTPYFVSLTSFYTLMPVNKSTVEKNKKWAAEAKTYVSNGPFTLKTWKHDQKIELAKSKHYWDAKSVKLDQINLPFIADDKTGYQQFKAGKIDETNMIPTDLTKTSLDKGEAETTPEAAHYYYKFNVDKKPFNNKKIRKAFALAIDRKLIVEQVVQGGQQPATGFVPWQMPDLAQNKEWVKTREDYLQPTAEPEKAKKLLEEGMKEEGWDQLPEVTIDYNTDEGHKKIAEAIQQMWKKHLGVDVKLRNSEWKVYLDKTRSGDFQVARYGWLPDYLDPMTFMDMYVTGGGNNDINFSNKKYDQLIKEAKSTGDQKKRMEAMHRAEDLLMDEMPIAPIYFYTKIHMQQDYVKGVKRLPDSSVSYIHAYVTEK